MKYGLILIAVLAASGCAQKETTSSSNIRTKGIAATITLSADASSTQVKALLRVGGDESNTYVILENGDKLVAESGGQKKDMQAESEGEYLTSFPTNAKDTEFNVVARRDLLKKMRSHAEAHRCAAGTADVDSCSKD